MMEASSSSLKRPHDQALLDEFDTEMNMMPLGSGREVGRSCHLISFKGKKVLLDCGIHPGYSGQGALPYFDEIDPSTIDVLLLTHFHVDHAASLPYFTEKTTFKGRVFMTHPTKAVMKVMLADYMKVSTIGDNDLLYDLKDLENCLAKVELLDFHQECEVSGIKFWAYQAGHVLGAAMFAIEIAGVRVLYTGDYSRGEDRHLKAAEIPEFHPDVLIIESTYGVQVHEKQNEREKRLLEVVERIVRRKGRVLMPIWALGRAQELCLILDEHWAANPDLQHIPVYYASKLANKALRVYETYTNMMNSRIRRRADMLGNPFAFSHISNLKSATDFDDYGPCVVMASPGMLQSGISRELLERWAPNERNGVILAGYYTQGTLAQKLIDEPKEITAMTGQQLQRKCSIDVVSFSAHADYLETRDFVEQLKPRHVILVHGDPNEMSRLKRALRTQYKKQIKAGEFDVHSPQNGTPGLLSMIFDKARIATALGSLAKRVKLAHVQMKDSKETNLPKIKINSLLVSKDFKLQVMDSEDLSTHTELSLGIVKQKQHVPFYHSCDVLIMLLERMFEAIDEVDIPFDSREIDANGNIIVYPEASGSKKKKKGKKASEETLTPLQAQAKAAKEERLRAQESGEAMAICVCDFVTVVWSNARKCITLSWNSGPLADMVADSIVSMAMLAHSSAAGLRIATGSSATSLAEESSRGEKSTSTPRKATSRTRSDSDSKLGSFGTPTKLGRRMSFETNSALTGDNEELRIIHRLLISHFGDNAVRFDQSSQVLTVHVDGAQAEINDTTKAVTGDENLTNIIKPMLRRVQSALFPNPNPNQLIAV